MAKITLGGSSDSIQTIDQNSYPGDERLTVNSVSGDTTLNINNPSNSDDVLDLTQTRTNPLGGTSTLNLGENTHVKISEFFDLSAAQTSYYNLGDGATLEYSPAKIGIGVANSSTFDLGADGTSTLIYSPGGFQFDLSDTPKVTGLTAGDQIQVTGATQGAIEGNNLVFRNDDGKILGKFDATGQNLDNVTFDCGTMNYACYLKGTHIATPAGEVKVETLQAGDKVLTAAGGVATVKWLGHRKLYKNRIPAKDAIRAFPILIKKGAIANNVPHRDLTLSPGHHVSFNGTLVPAMMLVNGQTIVQRFDTKVFEYVHVELEQFDIILAEGVPAESYVDTGNRSMFQNAAEVALNPDFESVDGRPEVAGIKVVQQGPLVETIRRQLLARAETMTHVMRTADAALCIEVNGAIIHSTPTFNKEGVYRFELPADTGEVRILSRAAVVRDVTPLARRDVRQIGVGLSGIAVLTDTERHEISLNEASLSGLNDAQDVRGTTMRWTNGNAVIPAALITSGAITLELTVLRTYTYWIDAQTQSQSRAA